MLMGRNKQAGAMGRWGAASLWLTMGSLPVMLLIMKRSRCGFADDRGWNGGGDCGRCDYAFALVILPLEVYNSHKLILQCEQ